MSKTPFRKAEVLRTGTFEAPDSDKENTPNIKIFQAIIPLTTMYLNARKYATI